MNCPNCGTSNLDNASICVNCGRPLNASTPAPPPPPPPRTQTYTPPPPSGAGFGTGYAPQPPGGAIPSYLLQSILVTLCCCLPFGIVAIIFAAQVGSKQAAGDYAGAMAASANARKWCWIALISGLVANAIIWIIYGAAIFSEIAAQ